MTQSVRKLTFEEYLHLNAEDWAERGLPEGRYKYTDGELVEVPSESELNDFIANLLMFLLASSGAVPLRLIRPHSCEIEVSGKPRTGFPDLVILREEHLSLTQKRLLITQTMPAPQLVVEVVSPGGANRRRDYEAKQEQYQKRGIPEYWLLNPETETIEMLALQDDQYIELGKFQGATFIESPTFAKLSFTAAQLFSAGSNG